MGLIKDIREIISEKRQQKELEFNFNELKLQIEEYKKCYFEEVKNFKGEHTHFAKAEIEDKILSKIEENEKILSVLTIDTKCNLGMLSAEVGLDNVVSKVLDNYEISLQQDSKGNNLGMYCANNKLEECVIKALDNKTASLQAQNGGLTMGMISAMRGLKNATLKAIENKECLTQQEKGTEWNIGMYAATYGIEDVVLQILDNKEASLQVSSRNKNLGMYCAENGLVKATAKALILYDETEKQIDSNGETIWTGCYITGKFRNDVLAEISNIKNKSNGNKHSCDDNNTNIKTFEECDNNTICDSEMEGGL